MWAPRWGSGYLAAFNIKQQCCGHAVCTVMSQPNNNLMYWHNISAVIFDIPTRGDRQQYRQKENSVAVKVLMIMILDQSENFIEGKTLTMKHIKEGVG